MWSQSSNLRLFSMFLGPKGENADLLERLVLNAVRDVVFWRRNFHPEDDLAITERIKRTPEFEDAVGAMEQELYGLLAQLKRGIPFYSPRYIGHMLGDQLLPAIVGYFAAMLHNPNNVSLEGSPETTRLEVEVGRQLAGLLGYNRSRAWGHITAGGTIANIEALWVARNLKYYPLAVKEAARSLGVESISVESRSGGKLDLLAGGNEWELLNLEASEILDLRIRLIAHCRELRLDGAQPAEQLVDERITMHSISGLGAHGFFSSLAGNGTPPGVVIAPATSHYSLIKAVELLGLGKSQLRLVPVDGRFRMDTRSLRAELEECLAGSIPVVAVVGVLGTTEEGSVDPIHEIRKIRDEFGARGLHFYFHCDAAWGGYMRTLFYDGDGKRVRSGSELTRHFDFWPRTDVYEAFQAAGHTDSVTVDPHKLGYVPYPCGAVVFRNEKVRNLISFDAPYIFRSEDRPGKPFIGRYIVEGSKPGAAAAACWLAHRVLPLNQSGYGSLIGLSIQGAQHLYVKCSRDLAAELERSGILLRAVTDPPDTNLFCFMLNKRGNRSLAAANDFNEAVYERLRFREEDVIQRHEFIISSVELGFEQYGRALPDGGHSMTGTLERLGIPGEEFASVKKARILRTTIMSPWMALAHGSELDYIRQFAAVLKQRIMEAAAP